MSTGLEVRFCGARGPRVALLHGWGWDSRCLQDLINPLAASLQVMVIDLPGYGRNAQYAVRDLDQCLDRLMALDPAPQALIGWSLGGQIALRWATRSAQVGALCMLAATPAFVARPDWPDGMVPDHFQAFRARLRSDRHDGVQRFAGLCAHGDAQARAVRSMLLGLLDCMPDAEQLEQGLDWLESAALDALAQLQRPSLWLAGQRDALVSPAACARAAAQCAGQYAEVAQAGHLPWLGRPGVAHRLAEFIHERLD